MARFRFNFEPLEEQEVVHHPHRIRWTEESFLDVPKQEEAGPSRFLGVFQGGRRIAFLLFGITIIFVIFFARIFYLQLLQGKYYALLSERNRIRIVVERATRGLILDVKERPIVQNAPEFLLTITPADLPQKEKDRQVLFASIAKLLNEPLLAITEEFAALPRDSQLRRQALPFREHLSYVDALRFMAAEERLPGFHIETRERRAYPENYSDGTTHYPMPRSIAHVIGYLGKIAIDELSARQKQGYLASDLVGKEGIERAYEQLLHGKHGKKYIETNAIGQEKSVVRHDAPETGKRIVLGIDLDLQRVIEESLVRRLAALPKRQRQGAAVVALDPRNGIIRALVSLPSYDPSMFSGRSTKEDITHLFQDPQQPLFSRAIAGEYPSGSTIKPLVALAALEEGVITSTTTVLSQGGIAVGPWFFPDWKTGGHGITDVRRAIAESVNTFFYTIGGGYGKIQGLGIDRLATWLKKFNFGAPLGIDIPQEAAGLIPTPAWKKEKRDEQWYIGDTYHLAIGQGDILVTPLQIAAMTSFFANGGTLWRPTLLADALPVALTNTRATPAYIQVIREGMRRTITDGSAQFLSGLPVAVAGKTGTAEWSSTRAPHAWFTGFAPYTNPELVLTVLVEEGGEGSSIAVPVAADAFREYFKN